MFNNLLPKFLFVLQFMVASAFATPQVSEFKPVTLERTEQRPFFSKITGREYMLYVGYPFSYNPKSTRKYPVVYVTDGDWNFTRMFSIGPNLWNDKVAPEYILVAIGYADKSLDCKVARYYELSPTETGDDEFGLNQVKTGGSPRFLKALKREIIPYVETNLPADPTFRVIAGSSMGGLFSLYSMYEEPGLFQGVIAVSPAVWWDHNWIKTRHEELKIAAGGGSDTNPWPLHARLFVSVGDQEPTKFTSAITAYNYLIRCTSFTDYAYEFRVIDGENHSSVAEPFTRGLRFVFEPLCKSGKVN